MPDVKYRKIYFLYIDIKRFFNLIFKYFNTFNIFKSNNASTYQKKLHRKIIEFSIKIKALLS